MEYFIYRLKDTDNLEPLRFLGSRALKRSNWWPIIPENYEIIYWSSCNDDTPVASALEGIFTKFNVAHPKGFHHYSLSVGDIVVLHGKESGAFFCDSAGWMEIPAFFEFVSADK